MAAALDQLDLDRARGAGGQELRFRRAGVLLLVALLAAGLANVFGQRPGSSSGAVPAASLKVYAPSRVRSGLYYEARFHVFAKRELKDARLLLDSGWGEGMTINTIEPSPVGEASVNGKISLDLGHVPEGQSYLLFVQLQVNPTNVGRRSQDVALYDGDERLLTIERDITVFP